MDNYQAKLKALAAKVQEEHQARLRIDGLACEANMLNAVTSIKPGRKYDKVDVGRSGKFMVERSTGIVFGVKGYGKIHRGHAYGTLDTIDAWYWGLFYPVPRTPANLASESAKEIVVGSPDDNAEMSI